MSEIQTYDFSPEFSSDEVCFGEDVTLCLTDVVNGKANINHTHSEYATVAHTHTGYVSSSDFALLEDVVDTKANSVHTHSEYATVTALDTLGEEVDGKASASHTHTGYASSDHVHDGYALTSHSHSEYSMTSHDHDEDYASISHTHSDYATQTALSELSATVSNKANASHSHDDMYYTETEVDTKLATKADSTHTHTGVYDASGAAASALTSANAYTDSKIDALVGDGASTTLDTIGEISSAIEDNQDAIDLLNSAIANKANATDLTSHTGNTTIHITATERNNINVAKTHADSTHAPSNAQANQNAFSNIVVGNTTISADTETDTFTFVAGNNVTLTPNVEGDSVTISATNTVYTHPTTAGNKHIPAGGSSGQILRWSSDGTAVWGADNNTTYSVATQTANGLMSAEDKGKLDSITEGANNYTLPSAGSSLGGVKTGGDVTISAGVITVNDDSHNHVISNVDGLQTALNEKAASNHNHNDIYYTETETDTLLSGKANSSHAHTIANVTGLQSALDGKAASSHGTHVTYGTTAPKANGTAAVGTASSVSRSDHVHPLQTTVSGNAGTATKLATARTISLTGDVSGSTSFDGSGNVSIAATVADDSHNHTIANVDGLQSALDGKSATSHTHSADAIIQMADALFATNSGGGVEYSYGSGSGKNVLTEISNMPQGFHTAYAIAGTTGNPETAESYRYLIHKTSTTIGWILAFGADGSIYSNYLAGANTYKGWKTIHDAKRKPLWTGSYYMTATHVATPSKKLSQCEHGWMLLWSDYDPDTSTVNNTDFCTTMIPNRNWAGGTWNGAAYYCDIPRYTAGTATDSESRVIKVLNVYDNKLVGTANNSAAPRNDVVLRAVYEF